MSTKRINPKYDSEKYATNVPRATLPLTPVERYYNSINGQKKSSAAGSYTGMPQNNVPQGTIPGVTSPAETQSPTATPDGTQSDPVNAYYEFLTKLGLSEKSGEALSYADYLTKLGLKEKTGAPMSYEQYLTQMGIDTNRDYQNTVRQAETDYAKAKATYGAKGESLARSGMTASGYSDYITGAGFAAMQGAKVAAADTKALADAQAARTYADYVEGVNSEINSYNNALKQNYASYVMNEETKAEQYNDNLKQTYANYVMNQDTTDKSTSQQIGTYITNLASEGADAETIRARADAFAKAMGYTLPGNIDDIIASTVAAAGTKTPAETTAETEQIRGAIREIINTGNNNGISGARIRQQLESAGYSAEDIDREMNKYYNDNFAVMNESIITATSLDGLYTNEQADNEVKLGYITAEQGEAYKQKAQEKRAELLSTAFADLPEDGSMTKTYLDKVNALYKSGDLTTEAYQNIYRSYARSNIDYIIDPPEDEKNAKEPVALLASYAASAEKSRKNLGDTAVDAMLDEFASSIQSVEKSGTIYRGMSNENTKGFNPLQYSYTITLDGDKKEKVGVYMQKDIPLGPQKAEESVQKALGTGEDGDLNAFDGALYVFYKGSWRVASVSPNEVGGADKNAAALYDLLVRVYSK